MNNPPPAYQYDPRYEQPQPVYYTADPRYQQPQPTYYATQPVVMAQQPPEIPIHHHSPHPTKPHHHQLPHQPAHASTSTAATELQVDKSWRDLGWAIFFWVHVIALVVIGFICWSKWHKEFAPADSPNDLGPLEHALPLIGICLVFGGILSLIALYLMQNYGVTLIWISLIFTIIMAGAVFLLALMVGDVFGVLIGGLIFLFTCWYIYAVRHKIPFAAAMLDVSLTSMSQFPSAWLLPVVGMIIMGGSIYLWATCAMSIAYAVDNGSSDGPRSVRGLIFFCLVLSYFWTMLVIKGWVHTCIAGVQATFYFLVPQATPKNPVLGAVKRASTTSFGSICFGSFLVALIRTLRFFVNMAYQQARNSNNALAACMLCCLECIIGFFESIINYINQYAFAICAIYGKAYMDSANQAWSLMTSRGFDAVVNDSLIGGVLNLCLLISGLATGIVGALIAYYAYNTDWRVWAGVGFLCGVALMFVVSEVVESSVISLFICLADDPLTLQQTKPDLYHKLADPLNVYYPNRSAAQGDLV